MNAARRQTRAENIAPRAEAPWLARLRAECARKNIKDVAMRLGYARTTISLVLGGRYPGQTDRIERQVIRILGGGVRCPHLKHVIEADACQRTRRGPMPTSDPVRLRHWSACRACPLNPDLEQQGA